MHDGAVVPSGLYWSTRTFKIDTQFCWLELATLLPKNDFRDGFCAMHC